MSKRKPLPKTVRSAIRASVPDGKLSKARIVLMDKEDHFGHGGYTQYSRENGGYVEKLGAPRGDDARGITIRGHETMHATRHKPTRKKPMTENEAIASQIIDDVNIETSRLPSANPKHMRIYNRAHLATAFRDVRNIVNTDRKVKRGERADSIAVRNGQLLCAVRTIAMLRHYGAGSVYDRNPEYKARARGVSKIRGVLGHNVVKAIGTIIQLGKMRRKRAMAISALVSMMESAPAEDMPELELPKSHGDFEGILGAATEGTALDGKMTIRQLIPRSVFCAKEKSITRKYAPDGVHLNPSRYVNAIVSGDGKGLFSRRVRQKPGGTVLIDASGSMHATKANLSAICELIPTATVAYYSGRDGSATGDLVVYALEGKRFAGELPHESIHGGNAIDLPAVKWMMKMPRPWTLVSDLEFLGGKLGSEIVAHALVERARERGDLTVHNSLDAAYEAFGGKGELKN